jgi:isopentenyldiphosphate isomerase
MKKPKVIIVDENDNPIGLKYREDIDYKNDARRCIGIWITNSNDEVLIAQRDFAKDIDPGKWGPAVAGTLEEGDTYESNAYKEMKEEIGVDGHNLILGPKQYSVFPRKYFAQWFYCKLDKPIEDFIVQKDEVVQVAWIKKDKLIKDLKDNPDKYVPSLPKVIDLLLKNS